MTLITSHVPVTFLLFCLAVVGVYSQGCSTSDGGRGQCVGIRDCPAVLQILQSAQSGRDPSAASKLRGFLRSGCTFGGGTFSVCCASSSGVNRRPQTPTPLTPPAPQTSSSSLLPERCGVRGLVDRVVSGEDAPLSAWPWMALLEAIVYVHPVCLPLNLQNDLGFSQDQFDQREGWVAGWGTTDPREARPADVLQQVLLPINSSLCSLDLRVFPDPHMALCAGGQRKDTCRGDSGGPMVIPNDRDLNYLVGIVSRGPVVCGAANTGGLYTNVNHYVPWILRNLRP